MTKITFDFGGHQPNILILHDRVSVAVLDPEDPVSHRWGDDEIESGVKLIDKKGASKKNDDSNQ